MGVRHVSKNFANGGLGTLQHGLAASSVYGPSIDMLIWDSGMSILQKTRKTHLAQSQYVTIGSNLFLRTSTTAMTENDHRDLDVFARQAIIGGQKVPVLWGLMGNVGMSLRLPFCAPKKTRFEFVHYSIFNPFLAYSFVAKEFNLKADADVGAQGKERIV